MRSVWRAIPVSLVVAVAVPVVVFGWVGMRQPLHLDGAMNVQVAERLAEHGEYARQYDFIPKTPVAPESVPWVRDHPSEVQTNGPYVFTAAAGLLVLGENQFTHQFANLAFIGLFGAVVWWLLKDVSRVLAAATPFVLLVLLPQPFEHALGGFGEIPALSLVLLALGLLAAAAGEEGADRALRLLSWSMVAWGLALITKTYMVGSGAALAVGVAALLAVRRLPWRRVLARLPLAAVPVVAFEAYKLVNLGGLGPYRDWWRQQRSAIAHQAGADPSLSGRVQDTGPEGTTRALDQLRLLAQRLDVSTEVLALLLAGAVVGAGVVGWWLLRRARSGGADGRWVRLSSLQVMATTMAVTYGVWFVALLPGRRTFVRRTYPMTVALLLALVLLVVLAHRYLRDREHAAARGVVAVGVAATLVAVLALGVPDRVGDAVTQDRDLLHGYEEAAEIVRDAPDGTQFYGVQIFGAPLVSLMADVPFRDLDQVNLCEVDLDRAVVVWDHHAQALAGDDPEPLGYDDQTWTLEDETESVRFLRFTRPELCLAVEALREQERTTGNPSGSG